MPDGNFLNPQQMYLSVERRDEQLLLTVVRRHSVDQLTESERAWVEFIRMISRDTDPAPTLARVQALRQLLGEGT